MDSGLERDPVQAGPGAGLQKPAQLRPMWDPLFVQVTLFGRNLCLQMVSGFTCLGLPTPLTLRYPVQRCWTYYPLAGVNGSWELAGLPSQPSSQCLGLSPPLGTRNSGFVRGYFS